MPGIAAQPRVLRLVVPSVPSLTLYPPRVPIDATLRWRRARWVRYAARAAGCLIAIATGLAIGGY